MEERLDDLGELGRRTLSELCMAFASICFSIVAAVGITSTPQIFEQFADRRQVLAEAVRL